MPISSASKKILQTELDRLRAQKQLIVKQADEAKIQWDALKVRIDSLQLDIDKIKADIDAL